VGPQAPLNVAFDGARDESREPDVSVAVTSLVAKENAPTSPYAAQIACVSLRTRSNAFQVPTART
jgi:hypothetical protein